MGVKSYVSCSDNGNLEKNSLNYFLEMAQRHRKSKRDNLIARVTRVLKENPAIIQNKMTKLAQQFYSRGREVIGEVHRLIAFIRFELYPEYLLVSEVYPEHDVIDLMFNFFCKRYPTFIILFFTKKQGYIATNRSDIDFPAFKFKQNYWVFKRNSNSLDNIRQLLRLQLSAILTPEKFSSKTWECYYDSQYIKSRKNIRLARKVLPEKMIRKVAGGLAYEAQRLDEEEKKQQKCTLLEFF